MASIDTHHVYDVRVCVSCGTRFVQRIELEPDCPECGGYSDREVCYRIKCGETTFCPQHGPVMHVDIEIVEPELLS